MKNILLLILFSIFIFGCNKNNEKNIEESADPLENILHKMDYYVRDSISPADDIPECSFYEIHTNILSLDRNTIFKYITEEINSFKPNYPDEPDYDTKKKTVRLSIIFSILSTNLFPLKTLFLENLDTNKNYLSAAWGLAAMGRDGIPYLLEALSNPSEKIREMAVCGLAGSLGSSDIEGSVADKIQTALLPYLKHQSSDVRYHAIIGIGKYCTDPDLCASELLDRVQSDPEIGLRFTAIRSLRKVLDRFKIENSEINNIILNISNNDQENELVRIVAKKFLKIPITPSDPIRRKLLQNNE